MSHLSPELRTSSDSVVLILKLTVADNGGVETVSVSGCHCVHASPPPSVGISWVTAAFYPLCRGNCSCTPVMGFLNVDIDTDGNTQYRSYREGLLSPSQKMLQHFTRLLTCWRFLQVVSTLTLTLYTYLSHYIILFPSVSMSTLRNPITGAQEQFLYTGHRKLQ